MHRSKRFSLLVAILFLAATAPGQKMEPCTPYLGGGWIFTGVGAPPFRPHQQQPQPYTAVLRHTSEQKLPDGGTIRYTTESVSARDTDGRTYQQQLQGCDVDENRQPHPHYQVFIFDNDNHMSTRWDVGLYAAPLVTVNHTHTSPRPPKVERPAPPQNRRQMQEWTHDDLGTDTIAGFAVKGERSTRTVPVGEEGNDVPLKVVMEQWRTTDGMLMRTVNEDPRYGRRTEEAVSVTLGPPDAALFQPPANYTVWDPDAKSDTPEAKP